MLKHRLIFGAIMLVALALTIHFDNKLDTVKLTGTVWQSVFLGRENLPAGLIMLCVFLTLIVLSARELCAIVRAKDIPVDGFMVTTAGVTGCVLIYIIPVTLDSQTTTAIVATIAVLLFLISQIKYSWLHQRTHGAVAVGSVTLLAFVYLGLLPGFYVAIRRWHDAWVIAAILLITKCCDIGAYFTGRMIGKHKLIPWLSPGKTWEGLAGGVLFSALVAVGLAALGNHFGVTVTTKTNAGIRGEIAIHFPLWAAFIAGALMGAVGQFGDLTASLFKRDAGIKDSGKTIPGFGGLLDVVDSPIVVAPLAFWLLKIAAVMNESGPPIP